MPKDEREEDVVAFTGDASTFKEITMLHLARITRLSSCELRGGYYSTFKTKSGEEKEYYVEDTREALENAIYCLAQMLISKFTKGMIKTFEKFEDDRLKLKKNFLKESKLDDKEVLGEQHYEDEDKTLLEEYKIQKLWLYKYLFTNIIKLLAQKNFLEVGHEVF